MLVKTKFVAFFFFFFWRTNPVLSLNKCQIGLENSKEMWKNILHPHQKILDMISMFSDVISYRVQEDRDLLMGKGLTGFGDSSH